ncbi:nucleotidyltransferase-like protein [Litchfieldia salsa]|uniref:Nucleotidyltransferase-like n=1 Tax=Litchfieldia salsa TaxID=930152 RepID=A0A1H0WMU8_9BACI|nr:nucleotidyltransferase-like protein [Litchfieldia salsa]SDP92050.1 Nucleotidyltransferase-like [Litchfieldia salsa]
MENILRPVYQERASHPNTVGIIIIEKKLHAFPVTDSFDTILLVIVKEMEEPLMIKHYDHEGRIASLYTVTEAMLKEWLFLGSNRKFVEWILKGKVIFDRNEYISNLKKELEEFPQEERDIKKGIEFGKLIRRYQDGKAFFNIGHYLDAYNNIVHALHHLARLAIIENGLHPEVTVWNQVKQFDPEIYKLYEELVESEESLSKRLELLFLASEFLINTRAKQGGRHLLEVLAERSESWLFGEILDHPKLKVYSVDLELMVEFLVEKQLIHVEKVLTKGKDLYHRNYSVSL